MPARHVATIATLTMVLTLTTIAVPTALGAGEGESRRADSALLPPVTAPGSAPLRLAWMDVSTLGWGVDGIAQSEVRSMLADAGIQLDWRRGKAGELAHPGEIRVVLVDRLLPDPSSGRPVLGATQTVPGDSPILWVHVSGVRAAVGLGGRSLSGRLPLVDRRNLGVALGRVIAHEIVHVLAPRVRHGRALMAASLKGVDLIGPRPSLDEPAARALRAALAGRSAPTAGRAEAYRPDPGRAPSGLDRGR